MACSTRSNIFTIVVRIKDFLTITNETIGTLHATVLGPSAVESSKSWRVATGLESDIYHNGITNVRKALKGL